VSNLPGARMSDRPSLHDDLFQPVLSADLAVPRPPYHVSRVVLAALGGPPAVTIGMLVIARRLRSGGPVLATIVASGLLVTGGLAFAVATVDPGDAVGSVLFFALAAMILYTAQLSLVLRRFRSWQLRGTVPARFAAAGPLSVAGALVCLAAVRFA
jgi:hypothetical protein